MMQESETDCAESVSLALELLKGKWAVQILSTMLSGPTRLSELKRSIPNASKKALSSNLRWLVSKHVVIRRDLSTKVLHVEYEIAGDMRAPIERLVSHLSDLSEQTATQRETNGASSR